MSIFLGVMSIALWAGAAVYVPTVLYLLLVNPPLYRAEQFREEKIFIIRQEPIIARQKQIRSTIITLMYIACCLLFGSVYVLNQSTQAQGIYPFNLMVPFLNITFGFAVITYLPVAIYVYLKDPLRFWEEGMVLNKLFVGYGLIIFSFSLSYAYQWLKVVNIKIHWLEVAMSLGIIVISSLALSYLPVLGYVLALKSNPFHLHKVRFNVIILIYCVSFMLFSGLYVHDWYVGIGSPGIK